jgi:CSLREA domain-containing protein
MIAANPSRKRHEVYMKNRNPINKLHLLALSIFAVSALCFASGRTVSGNSETSARVARSRVAGQVTVKIATSDSRTFAESNIRSNPFNGLRPAMLKETVSAEVFFSPTAYTAQKKLPGSPQSTFVVNSELDSPDLNPGDGICTDGAGHCTLRAALQEANAGQGADAINFNWRHSGGRRQSHLWKHVRWDFH